MTTNINELLEEVFVTTEIKTPRNIADSVFLEIPEEDYAEVLKHVLPAYAHNFMVKRRAQRPVSEDLPEIEETTFAEDDLLADDVATIVKTSVVRKVKQRGSAKVDQARLAWQHQLQNRVYNGKIFKIFADFTSEDLKGAAESLRSQAAGFKVKATWYDNLAAQLKDGETLDSLDKDPTKV